MYASTVFIALIAAVSAVPTYPSINKDAHNKVKTVSVKEVGDVCGNNNTIHCCNSVEAGSTNGGLLGLDLHDVLSGCDDITVQVLGLLSPPKDHCREQTVCCGETLQNVR